MKILLWIVIGVAVIGGGYYLVVHYSVGNQNQQPIIIPTTQTSQIQTQGTSTTITTNTTPAPVTTTASNSSFTCADIFPLDVLESAFPGLQFKQSGETSQSNSVCTYTALSGFNIYLGNVTIVPDPAGINYDTELNTFKSTSNYAGESSSCAPSNNVGNKSTECIYGATPDSLGSQGQATAIFFEASDNKYVVGVILSAPTSNVTQTAEQMAKEVDSKLSSY